MKNKLIVLRGPICSGKSTVSRVLREQLRNSSVADFDAIKQQIDYRASSSWRRDIALRTAVYLAGELLQTDRNVIAEIHSAIPVEYDAFQQAASVHNCPFLSFLIMAPLDVCLQRNRDRAIRDVWYMPKDSEVIDYWNKTYTIPEEPQYDTTRKATDEIVLDILRRCEAAG
jgi:predicted kinase